MVEVARGAEYMGEFIRSYMEEHKDIRPVISSVCPAVTRLISVRYPELADHVIPIAQPMEIMARLVRERMIKEGYPEDEIGFFYISPCTANVTSVRLPIGFEKRMIDGAIGISEIFWPLFNIVKGLKKADIKPKAGAAGIHWASIGGEVRMLGDQYRSLAIDGLNNIVSVFDSLSMGRLQGIDFIEAMACVGGCVGGVLNIENTYVAKEIIRQICRKNTNPATKMETDCQWQDFKWELPLVYQRALSLDAKPEVAMLKLEAVDDILKKLPGMDCGACGAPNCRALAEDIVQDLADQMDCIFVFRKRVTDLAEDMIKISRKMPISIQSDEEDK